MNAIGTHFRIRLLTAIAEPVIAGVMLLSGMTTLLVWHGPSDPSGASWVVGDEWRLYAITQLVLIWVFIWPILISRTSP